MHYIVLNADVKNSRKQHFNRKDFQTKIDYINEEFRDDIVMPFSMLKGDEIQGLLNEDSQIFRLLRLIRYAFLPYEMRFGIGYGSIEEPEQIKSASSSFELNGEAFFNARDAIDEMKDGKGKKEFAYNVYFKTGNSLLDERLSLIYSYVDDQLGKWKDDVWDIILLEEQAYKHRDIARELLNDTNASIDDLKRERVNITKKIQRSNWYKIKETEVMLNQLFIEGIK